MQNSVQRVRPAQPGHVNGGINGGMQSAMARPAPAAPAARLGLDALVSPGRTGLGFPNQMQFSAWQRIGKQLFLISDSSVWWLGDWLVYGESSYPDRYRHAVEETSLDYQTLRNYAWVARKFPLSRRREKLSFQHHAEVAGLTEPDQDTWLDRSEHFGWSRNQLRMHLRRARRGEPDALDGSAGAEASPLVMSIAAERHRLWLEAARSSSLELEDWVTRVLDMAARSTVAIEAPADVAEAQVAEAGELEAVGSGVAEGAAQ